MAVVTINTVRKAVIAKLKSQFPDMDVYGEEIAQGFQEPCFFVKLFPVSQTQVVGNRYMRYHSFDIHYFSNAEYENDDMHDMAEQLYELMEYIGTEDNLHRGTEMKHEIQEGVLHFFVDYNFHVSKVVQKEFMEDLEFRFALKE